MNPKHALLKRALGASALGVTTLTADKALGMEMPRLDRSPTLSQREISPDDFIFQHDHVLGTSMKLIVRASHPGDADECEMQVLGEIERLRAILSTYDPASEISGYMAGGKATSTELAEVLAAYDRWGDVTDGALDLNMAEVIRLWKQAAQENRLPDQAALGEAGNAPRACNVDALGKGYIIDRAVEIARRFAPGGLLNIGGDIRAWGDDAWLIGIANPAEPAVNAEPMAFFELRDAAVATSGGYLRYSTILGERYSHLIDPRTQWATPHLVSATAVAADCVSANAVSTAACVLGIEAGVNLALRHASEYLVMDATGAVRGSSIFMAVGSPTPTPGPAGKGLPPPADKPAAPASAAASAATPSTAAAPAATTNPAAPWPKDFQAIINLTLKTQGRGGRMGGRHPYVAIWVEDSQKKLVRTITVWGNSPKYLRELSTWLSIVGPRFNYQSVTHATRAAGSYAVVWDGLDDKGKPLPAGDYRINIEINRENGTHVKIPALLHCGDTAQTVAMPDTAESSGAKIKYGPKTPSGAKTPATTSPSPTQTL